jgi:BACON domain-containing protein
MIRFSDYGHVFEGSESQVDGSTICSLAAGPSMTTPAKPSSVVCVLQLLRFRACLLVAGLALVLPLVGCGFFHNEFDVAVGNRTSNPVSIFANGGKIGDLGSNSTASFSVEETPIPNTTVDSSASPTAPRPMARVTFSVQDMTTGVLSAGVTTTMVKEVTTYVEVAPCTTSDTGPAAPCVSVSSVAPVASGAIASQGQTCTFSLSSSSQSFDAIGGTGTVSVSTSTGCAWNAISSDAWLTIVSGASGTGNGVVEFRVTANNTTQTRTAFLSIGGQRFTVSQTP